MSSEAPRGQLAALTTASQVAMKTTLQRARDLKTTSVFVCVPQIKGALSEQRPSVREWCINGQLGKQYLEFYKRAKMIIQIPNELSLRTQSQLAFFDLRSLLDLSLPSTSI